MGCLHRHSAPADTTQLYSGGCPCVCPLLPVLAYLTLILMTSSPTAIVAYPAPNVINRRWFNPCHGSAAVADMPDITTTSAPRQTTSSSSSTSVSTTSAAPTPPLDADLSGSFHLISTKATRLKRHVRELKDLYVTQRFRDNSIVQDLEQMGIRLDGMPEAAAPTIAHVNSADVIQTIHQTFEHLARVSVFVDQARIGESLAINEPYSYEHHFDRIENHHEHGLYWLLCAVQRLVHVTGSPIADHVVDTVSRMRVVEVDRNALRHTRDYLVLRDLERILARLGVEFASLRHYHRRRRHHGN